MRGVLRGRHPPAPEGFARHRRHPARHGRPGRQQRPSLARQGGGALPGALRELSRCALLPVREGGTGEVDRHLAGHDPPQRRRARLRRRASQLDHRTAVCGVEEGGAPARRRAAPPRAALRHALRQRTLLPHAGREDRREQGLLPPARHVLGHRPRLHERAGPPRLRGRGPHRRASLPLRQQALQLGEDRREDRRRARGGRP